MLGMLTDLSSPGPGGRSHLIEELLGLGLIKFRLRDSRIIERRNMLEHESIDQMPPDHSLFT